MAAVDSDSTRDQVIAAIANNASYVEDNSVAKCKAFITAVRLFLHCWAFEEARTDLASMRFNTAQLRADLQEATGWLERNGGSQAASGGVRQFSVANFRGSC